MHIGFVLLPFVIAVVLSELLFADDIVFYSETIERLRNKLMKWTEAFESKVWKLSF